ncbi:branched-chain amino acid ABC transporter permease [Lutimaribacter sp. EGI FJ00015]|uniref:Branched-chain amino acid ABC transporter permease n=1 Tax=Lutimaribacter degradans TaxID=2945989 RepID=A0ACC5ZUF1_9RHOB|nr:branched-chain amino acid ABC transporter permease [Lutimaribacter sp. EGI FJ00013]MCM2561702.1 branched-chain amino acid ABC transporter permease [Lutimaribacter sp. EGI FJ00013]MCO0612585.1 branched-chain amino acid ABC transporter permease [Lutimaribacter sp. EGI FJ00015]
MTMDAVFQIIVGGLTLGSTYALAAIGLSLTYGTMGMFNMAHGVLMTIGAYSAYVAASILGLPLFVGFAFALLVGMVTGGLLHLLVVRYMLDTPRFEINVIVVTAGVAILLEDLILKQFGAYPFRQPVQLAGSLRIGEVTVTAQNLVTFAVAFVLISATAWVLLRTRFGRAIRATAMDREAAMLMGVNADRTFLHVLLIAGGLAAAAGVLISAQTTLSPAMGTNPLLRAFVICVFAGLGSVGGAGIAAILLGLFEVAIQYTLGVQYGFPFMLGLVVVVIIFRPAGLFGHTVVERK